MKQKLNSLNLKQQIKVIEKTLFCFKFTDSSDEESNESEEEEEENKKDSKNIVNEKLELRKQFFLSKINPFEIQESYSSKMQTEIQQTYIDYESAELVSRYLASKRPFSKSFETFLKHVSILCFTFRTRKQKYILKNCRIYTKLFVSDYQSINGKFCSHSNKSNEMSDHDRRSRSWSISIKGNADGCLSFVFRSFDIC